MDIGKAKKTSNRYLIYNLLEKDLKSLLEYELTKHPRFAKISATLKGTPYKFLSKNVPTYYAQAKENDPISYLFSKETRYSPPKIMDYLLILSIFYGSNIFCTPVERKSYSQNTYILDNSLYWPLYKMRRAFNAVKIVSMFLEKVRDKKFIGKNKSLFFLHVYREALRPDLPLEVKFTLFYFVWRQLSDIFSIPRDEAQAVNFYFSLLSDRKNLHIARNKVSTISYKFVVELRNSLEHKGDMSEQITGARKISNHLYRALIRFRFHYEATHFMKSVVDLLILRLFLNNQSNLSEEATREKRSQIDRFLGFDPDHLNNIAVFVSNRKVNQLRRHLANDIYLKPSPIKNSDGSLEAFLQSGRLTLLSVNSKDGKGFNILQFLGSMDAFKNKTGETQFKIGFVGISGYYYL